MIIENFKAFKNLEIDIKPLTILVWPNSGGKSSILNSIKLIKQTLDGVSEILRFKGTNDFGTFSDVIHQGSEKEMRFRFEFDDSSYFDVLIAQSHDGELFTNKFSCSNGDFKYSVEGAKNISNIDKKNKLLIPKKFSFESKKNKNLFKGIEPLLCRNTFFYTIDDYFEQIDRNSLFEAVFREYSLQYPSEQIEEIKNCYYKILNSYSDIKRESIEFYEDIKTKFKNIEYIDPIRFPASRKYPLNEEKKVGSKGEYVVQVLSANLILLNKTNVVFNNLDLANELKTSINSEKETTELKLVTAIAKSGVNYADVGCGTSQILPIIVQSLSLQTNSIIMIEQPEAHLHPKIQADLCDFFIESIKRNKSKYIIETHSEYFIERIRTHIMKEPKLTENVAIYYIDQNEKTSSSEKTQITIDSKGNYSELPENYLTKISIREIDNQLEIMLRKMHN